MSEYGRELHRYIIGEIYTDGRKTPWRIEQEKRRAEEMGERQFVSAPQIKERQVRPKGIHVAPRSGGGGKCKSCNKSMNINNAAGECHHCARHAKPRRFCGCGARIWRSNKSGMCLKCRNETGKAA